eukprot:1565757-Rhodomonas_salina.1
MPSTGCSWRRSRRKAQTNATCTAHTTSFRAVERPLPPFLPPSRPRPHLLKQHQIQAGMQGSVHLLRCCKAWKFVQDLNNSWERGIQRGIRAPWSQAVSV